jgi:hypothetical protein
MHSANPISNNSNDDDELMERKSSRRRKPMASKEEGAADDSIPDKKDGTPSQKKHIFLSAIPLLAIFVLLSRFYYSDDLLIGLQAPPSLPSTEETTTPAGDGDNNQLGQLHPEAHIHRPETTQKLEWRISAGLRQPDGVQKRVYLVNGGCWPYPRGKKNLSLTSIFQTSSPGRPSKPDPETG